MDLPARQPCIISSLPCMFEVMKITSAPKLFHVSLRSCMVSGRPPRFFESQRIILSGSMCLWTRPDIVGPKVFSWSEPIQMRNLEEQLEKRGQRGGASIGIPIRTLDAGRQCCPNAGSSTDADSSFEHSRGMPNTSYYGLMNGHLESEGMSVPNFISRVHTVFGGSETRALVKSP